MHSSINIVIPVYNEGENISRTLSEISTKIRTSTQIYAVYDMDEDTTIPAIKDYLSKNHQVNISLVKNKYGRGALNAIKTGFERVRDGIVLVVMADLSDDLSNVDEMLNKINQGYDLVCGSRYMKGGRQIGGPWLKKTLSRIAGVSLYYLAGLPTHDVTNSFKMYTKQLLNRISIESNGGFELGMEIVIKAFIRGYKITEVPCIWSDRSAGKSRFKLWQWLPNYLHWYWLAITSRYHKRSIA